MPTSRSLLTHLLSPRKALSAILARTTHRWTGAGAIRRRRYSNYSDYVAHQQHKLESRSAEWLLEHEQTYPVVLSERLGQLGVVRPGMTVLCLAARLGGEVRAFLHLGCFAVGIDLNPGAGNKYVLTGDFHDLQFGSGTIDVLFCNALDHAFDIPRMMLECRRVLRPEGHLLLEIVSGDAEGYSPGHFEATIWKTIDDVLDVVRRSGFSVVSRHAIKDPWSGELVCLKPESSFS